MYISFLNLLQLSRKIYTVFPQTSICMLSLIIAVVQLTANPLGQSCKLMNIVCHFSKHFMKS